MEFRLRREGRDVAAVMIQLDDRPVSVGCGVLAGVDAIAVTIEATMRGESSAPRILGSVDAVVREAYHRVLCAFTAQGIDPPRGAPLLNFAPAGLRKTGTGFDLPMALALAGAGGLLPRERFAGLAAFGEVSLDGGVLPVRGVIPVALAAAARDWGRLLTSPEDAGRAAVVPGVQVIPVANLRDAIACLGASEPPPAAAPQSPDRVLIGDRPATAVADLAEIRGHETPKTALVVAAAGRHNLLLVGPPGSGKSALLLRLSGLLPPARTDECLEILKIYSAHAAGCGGRFSRGGRPFRAPHHTSSTASLLGGGTDPRPGEVTLAQHGVLFLDELPEFRREALEALRQPLEERFVTIGRAARTVTMPADFLLVAAMNPCPCGYAGDASRPCACSPHQRQRYRARISGPLLDRFDLCIEVPALPPETFAEPAASRWATAPLGRRVLQASMRQQSRHRGREAVVPNGRLEGAALARAIGDDPQVPLVLEQVMRAMRMSGRARVRILRVARTLADLDGDESVAAQHVRRAARLRGYDPLGRW